MQLCQQEEKDHFFFFFEMHGNIQYSEKTGDIQKGAESRRKQALPRSDPFFALQISIPSKL